MVLKSKFRGMMAPVFTPFDQTGQLNLPEVPKYAKYLSEKKVQSVLINGTVGEGTLMSAEERKKLAETWVTAAKTTGLEVMVHVGGTNFSTVVQLAKHAESIGVSSILCLPDLFYRPDNLNDLVDYLKMVSAAAPKTPLFYYNYPALTGVKLDMVEFLETGFDKIPTLSGIKHTDTNLEEALLCTQVRGGVFTIFLGNDLLISGALCMGIDSFIATVLNFAAEEVYEIQDKIKNGDNVGARVIQARITDLASFVKKEMSWVNGFKKIISSVAELQLGNPRSPLKSLSQEQQNKLDQILKSEKWISTN